MGPSNVALVKLFKADQQWRAAQTRLDAASKDVRVQQRRVDDLAERHRLSHTKLMESKSKSGQVELDLKTRDAHIDKLRTQQQNAKNNKEYQAFLVEINTEKVDKTKIEEEMMALMEQVEKGQQEEKDLAAQLETEKTRLEALKQEIGSKLTVLQAEIETLRGPRDEAHAAVPPKAREVFDRLADRHEGEALSALAKSDPRREEYVCSACNMELVTDIYNKLHSRDELVFCPSCHRVLYIPEDLPPEAAVHKKKPSKPRKAPEIGAARGRQESAADVLNSLTPDVEEQAGAPEAPDAPTAASGTSSSSEEAQ